MSKLDEFLLRQAALKLVYIAIDVPDQSSKAQVTKLLRNWRAGQPDALDRLIPVVEAELRRIATGFMRHERNGHSLQVSGLVNEAYLRLIDQKHVEWHDRHHFFAITATCMRRILVDHARQRRAAKRGGLHDLVPLDGSIDVASERGIDLIALDDALNTLEKLDPRQVRVVELRYFGGFTNAEIAKILDVSVATVKRDWDSARILLTRELTRT